MSETASKNGEFDEPSLRVVEAVADAEGVDPRELEPPLYDVVDPVALDDLFEPTSGAEDRNGRVSFRFHGYDVSVDADGVVDLERSR